METILLNPHPGEILLEEMLKPLDLSVYRLAKDIDVPASRLHEIIKGDRAITLDTSLRLGRYFNQSPQFWLGLQIDFDEAKLKQNGGLKKIESIKPRELASIGP